MTARPQADRKRIREDAAARVIDAHWGRAPASEPVMDSDFADLATLWEEARTLGTSPAYAELLGGPTWRERWTAFRPGLSVGPMIARPAFASFLAIMLLAAGLFIARPWAPQFETRTAETRELPLEDGSRVALGAKSGLDVDFSPQLRKVRLTSGEAFFSVAHNRTRPFLVEAGNTLIRVVGTKFNVKVEGDHVRVLVLEGVVQVMRADGTSERLAAEGAVPKVQLIAGEQVETSASDAALPQIKPLGTAEPGGWRLGRLTYQEAPLSEIVADANRYRNAPIRIASRALGDERLTTSFRVGQIDKMLDTLPATLPLEVARAGDGSVELQPRR